MRILFYLIFTVFPLTAISQRLHKIDTLEREEETIIHNEFRSFYKQKKIEEKYNNEIKKFPTEKVLDDTLKSLYDAIGLGNYNLDYKVFRHGMIGFFSLKQAGRLNEKNLLSIIDFTKSSCEKRFYTIDLENKNVLFHSLVSHGRNTGQDTARSFSNDPNSYQSSLGFYVTGEEYVGSKGYSMRLDGTEAGINDNMRERSVVMHDAEYVSEEWVKNHGRLGRSQGCPALPKEISKKVIDTIKHRTAIFAYYNDDTYIKASNYLDLNQLVDQLENPEDKL
ncbi:MAG: murein L,D-transpeptidase catalytic domain family protein [Bacteroidota bacterium]|nr:murein L,D-transpeptidase catalytic domain family protein [Bacteroidota bacterium]